jgi:uncharacterized membrane protein HdeD (DUF308 family)
MMTPVDVETAKGRQMVAQMARWWWAWLVAGILWVVASAIILQFDRRSAALVGVVLGVMFIVAGLEELTVSALTQSGWKWLWIIFGVLLIIGGIWALVNPIRTFVVMADILGFLFLLVGVGWIIQAMATKESDSLWWLGLVAGIVMIGLGFWAASQLLATQAFALLFFAGIWALLKGITDIFKAFQIRRLGELVAASPSPSPLPSGSY